MALIDNEQRIIKGLEDWSVEKCKECPVSIYKSGVCNGFNSTFRDFSSAQISILARHQDVDMVQSEGLCLQEGQTPATK